MFQGEYFADSFESLDHNRYILFHGRYVQAGFLLYGEFFGYDSDYAVPSRPVSDRALELVARINYTDLDDGRMNDNGNPFYSNPLFMGQLRLQYVF